MKQPRLKLTRSSVLAAAVAMPSLVICLVSCTDSNRTGPTAEGPAANPSPMQEGQALMSPSTFETSGHGPLPPAPGGSVRVGGDLSSLVTGQDGDYRFKGARIDTPLPKGYPKPTPPGAIELKTYPSVRVAEVRGTDTPDRGMNRAFWPLFNHIKKHDIAMTSPVEMSYAGGATDNQPAGWTMAFLYRTPDLNEVGQEGQITVRDQPQVTVLAVGLQGDYSMELVERGRVQIEEFLTSNPQWRIAGDWRSLYYNGPSLFFWKKWAEVQVPVVPAG